MKIAQIALVVGSLIFASFAYGHNPFRPQKQRSMRRKKDRKNKRKKTKKNAGKPTFVPKVEGMCFGDFPLPEQETGCPCFTLETITSHQMDSYQLDECRFSFQNTRPAEDSCPCLSECSCCAAPQGYEYLDFDSTYKEPLGGDEPPMARFVRSNFYATLDVSDGGKIDAMCFATVSKDVSRDYGDDYDDYDYEEYRVEMGESHNYQIQVELTEEEFNACAAILKAYKDSVPGNKCDSEDYEDYDDDY